MAELALPTTPTNPRRAIHFEWLIPVLIRPRKTFAEIAAQNRGVWLVPILVLTVCTLLATLVSGYEKQASGGNGPAFEVPDDFYYTPEQQAQFEQQASVMQGPFFVYVLPALGTLISVWFGWLILGGILHLILTLLGGRSSTGATMNIVAWASIPMAVRALLQTITMLIQGNPIVGPGMSGFVPADAATPLLVAAACLGLLDLFLIWQIVLLVIGVRASSALTVPRAIVSVILALGLIMLIQTIFGFGRLMISSANIMPFF